jgi:hypothetical protein
MREALLRYNEELLRDIQLLRTLLEEKSSHISFELKPFYDCVLEACEQYRQRAQENLRLLGLGTDIYRDILSETQNLTIVFRIFTVRLVNPVLRAETVGLLALKMIYWLHTSHAETRRIPAAVGDGEFSSYPAEWIAIYYVPIIEQSRLLYLPMCFHEFGHVLYECHKDEMDNLVRELQQRIKEILEPFSQREDLFNQRERRKRNRVAERWYEWTQELFCDAVGFHIGGLAFVRAFSEYFRMLSREEYYLSFDELIGRIHPVTWLRVRILADRVRKNGYKAEADVFEDEWAQVAETLDIEENHSDFYFPEMLNDIRQTIEDMLTEASPVHFTDELTRSTEERKNVIKIINEAWNKFENDPNEFALWQTKVTADYIEN